MAAFQTSLATVAPATPCRGALADGTSPRWNEALSRSWESLNVACAFVSAHEISRPARRAPRQRTAPSVGADLAGHLAERRRRGRLHEPVQPPGLVRRDDLDLVDVPVGQPEPQPERHAVGQPVR